ncbi:hypothetical protein ACLMJK_009275 [Lecanora helva]
MSSSDLSELSSALSTEEDIDVPISKGTLDHYFKGKSSHNANSTVPTVKRKRPPSPPHEYVIADNPDIAFICMFRSRFSDAFPKSLPHYGPQDIENGIVGPVPGENVERLLCALLGLVLNRKKDIEKGHYTRALEEAIQTHTGQWDPSWQGRNPLHGGGSFNKMTTEERLTILKTLILWSLGSSEAIQTTIKESYKRQRQDDDLNQPLSVQPWGRDGDKRRFWLIEGQDDTHFRLYRESNPALKHSTWRSMAGTIDEVRDVAERLGEENSLLSRRLRDRIMAAIPRFEASEDKRKRRDYRLARKAQFTRPDPGFSLYEGRTRGKRMKYTFSDEEDGGSDALSTRRSNRQSGMSTPAEPSGPTFTASGRQVRSRHGGAYGEAVPSRREDIKERSMNGDLNVPANDEMEPMRNGRPPRTIPKGHPRKQQGDYDSLDSMDDGTDVTSSGGEWQGGDEEEPDDPMDDEEDEDDAEMSDDSFANEEQHQSLMISLKYRKTHLVPPVQSLQSNGNLPNGVQVPATGASNPDPAQSHQPIPTISHTTQAVPLQTPQDSQDIPQHPPPAIVTLNTDTPTKPEHHLNHVDSLETQAAQASDLTNPPIPNMRDDVKS